MAFDWKGGIGTSWRVLRGGHVVGVLVQSNYGGHLIVSDVPMDGYLPDRPAWARRRPRRSTVVMAAP